MRIKSPVGEYDYRVTAVRLGRGGLEVDGSLGMWETTMVVEPKDAAPVLMGAGVLVAAVVILRLLR